MMLPTAHYHHEVNHLRHQILSDILDALDFSIFSAELMPDTIYYPFESESGLVYVELVQVSQTSTGEVIIIGRHNYTTYYSQNGENIYTDSLLEILDFIKENQ